MSNNNYNLNCAYCKNMAVRLIDSSSSNSDDMIPVCDKHTPEIYKMMLSYCSECSKNNIESDFKSGHWHNGLE